MKSRQGGEDNGHDPVNGVGGMKFIVVLHTDDGQRFGVTVPDLPGCFSGGDSLDDALCSVREAIDEIGRAHV